MPVAVQQRRWGLRVVTGQACIYRRYTCALILSQNTCRFAEISVRHIAIALMQQAVNVELRRAAP